MVKKSTEVRRILDLALQDAEVSEAQGLVLCQAQGADLHAIMAAADELRIRQSGDVVTYVVNRNINFTNVCIKHCTFCAFSRDHRQEQAYMLPMEEVIRRAKEAHDFGATEVCIQAGLPPKLDGFYYVDLVKALKKELPDLHIHAFSPEEVQYGAVRSNLSVREYLLALKEAGHDTLPGTSAEILDDDLRNVLAKGRITSAEWIDLIKTAHEVGIRTTSTIMYGHIETYAHWMKHFSILRTIQKETGGFTEFVPLSFVHQEAPMYQQKLVKGVRQGATGAEVIKMHAIARIMLGQTIRNIQTSWVKEGPKMSQLLLTAGANDLGGTLMNESISTSAGAQFGQLIAPAELRRVIRDLGRIPAERTTSYRIRKLYDSEEPDDVSPLDELADPEAQFGTYRRLALAPEYHYVHPQKHP